MTLAPVYFLLVDDLEENLLALAALLRRDGLVLLKATSGSQALEYLLKYDIALALVDVQMPIMDGFELAELMRGSERTRRVPIIFLTAGSSSAHRHFQGYEAGAVDFILKPIEPTILKGKADVFFELYRQRQEVALQRDELKAATVENTRLLAESRRQAEALREADRIKDDFLAMLAHELRNPLAPVQNAVEILRLSDPQGSNVESAREIISRQVAHMARLIDDLLDVARITRGKMELRLEICDLAQIVRQTAEDYAPALSSAGIMLSAKVSDKKVIVAGDRVRLAQVIGNLLHNASKFTSSDGCVEIALTSDSESGIASIVVQDNGIGMEPAVVARLFEPFSQAGQSLDRAQGGLGLGLALVKGLLQLHGGAVEAKSAGIGQGSVFTLRLPLAKDVSEPHVASAPPRPELQNGSMRILVIEDNRDAAVSLEKLLSLQGYEVKVAFEGGSGLDYVRSFRPHVVLSDLGLPGEIDGHAIARHIRNDPEQSDVLLVALSGYGQMEDKQRALAAGFDLYLVKPMNFASLQVALHKRRLQIAIE